MTWNSGMNEEPEKVPEDLPSDEEPKKEETKNWWEKDKTPEPSHEEVTNWQEKVTPPEVTQEESADLQDKVVIPEASPEVAAEEQNLPVVPKAVESKPLTWLKSEEVDELKSRWNMIQVQFVDEPRKSVEQADALVEEVLKRINQAFTDQRATLDEKWVNHEDISTEDLRVTLQSYRSFFNRFLAF
jgi:hypothetical protein